MNPILAKPTTLSQTVANYICEQVAGGGWQPGERMPSIDELVGLLDVSHTTVREAIQGLSSAGLLEVRHGVGVFIKPSPLWLQNRPEIWGSIFEKQALIEILEAREILEEQIAVLAVERATPKDLKNMAKCLADLQAGITAGDYVLQDLAFHQAMWEAAHNKLLLNMAQAVLREFKKIIEATTQYLDDIPILYSMHADIYEAMVEGSAPDVRQAIRIHFSSVHDNFLQTIQELSEDNLQEDT